MADLPESADSIDQNSMIRASLWGDYVGWSGRKQAENGFLERHLLDNGCHVILDAALGDGVDTISLLQQGFNVYSNEVDQHFLAVAQENAKRTGVQLRVTRTPWAELSSVYPDETFDAVVCLGHSIGCELDEHQRRLSLQAFQRVLRPGGVLIVDERVFRNLEESAQVGVAFRPSGRLVYTGHDAVELRFLRYSKSDVDIEYTHLPTGRTATYRVCRFAENELVTLLQDAGFLYADIQVFGDYGPRSEESEFYQYVCRKAGGPQAAA